MFFSTIDEWIERRMDGQLRLIKTKQIANVGLIAVWQSKRDLLKN